MSGEVFLPARTLRQAAKRIGTPFYVYDEAGLRQNAAVARTAFSWNAGFALWFPLRWNPNPAVLSILRESGCGVECTSAAELAHAERCGFSGEQIRYAPQMPDEAGERLAAQLGAELVLDDPALRPGFLPERVLLRIWPGVRLHWRGKTVVQSAKSKFGMTKRESFFLADYYASQGAEVGLGLWLAENTCEAELYPAETQLLLDWMREFRDRGGGRMTHCDLGAGPGSSRQTGAPDAELAQIAAKVREVAGTSRIRFSAAPGAWLAAGRGMLITRVLAVKERERPMIVLDLPSPVQLWPGSIPPAGAAPCGRQDGRRAPAPYVRCRRLRPSLRDRISDRQILPSVKAGDLIALLDVGVHAPNPVLPEFLWSGGELFRLTDEPPFRVTAW